MATIGSFTKTDTGFSGAVKTLTLNVKATFRADDKENDKAPDFRIFAGATEFGWNVQLEQAAFLEEA